MTTKKGLKQRGAEKMSRLPVKFPASKRDELLPKQSWIRAQFPGAPKVIRLKNILRPVSYTHLTLPTILLV